MLRFPRTGFLKVRVLRRRPAVTSGRPRRWWPQFVVVAAILWGLDVANAFHQGVRAAGDAHGAVVDSISRHIGGGVGLPMNRWLAAHPLPASAAAVYYVVVHVLATGVVGAFLLRSRPPRFRLHRNALIAVGLIGLVVFWLYPVAPPRMLPGYRDIAAASVPYFRQVLDSRAADQFAALPSLHMAWAFWVAVASQSLLRRPLWRVAVWMYPLLTTADVLATANHYLLDVVTAPAVLLLAYGMAVLASQVRLPGAAAQGRQPAPGPAPDPAGREPAAGEGPAGAELAKPTAERRSLPESPDSS